MRVVGLQSAAGQKLNGAEGTLVRFDKSTERWDTKLGDGEQKALIPLKVLSLFSSFFSIRHRVLTPLVLFKLCGSAGQNSIL